MKNYRKWPARQRICSHRPFVKHLQIKREHAFSPEQVELIRTSTLPTNYQDDGLALILRINSTDLRSGERQSNCLETRTAVNSNLLDDTETRVATPRAIERKINKDGSRHFSKTFRSLAHTKRNPRQILTSRPVQHMLKLQKTVQTSLRPSAVF